MACSNDAALCCALPTLLESCIPLAKAALTTHECVTNSSTAPCRSSHPPGRACRARSRSASAARSWSSIASAPTRSRSGWPPGAAPPPAPGPRPGPSSLTGPPRPGASPSSRRLRILPAGTPGARPPANQSPLAGDMQNSVHAKGKLQAVQESRTLDKHANI